MAPRCRRRGEDGFVIVGVVMFVLALTILGLSLFSLSTTEAKFMGNEQDDIQAYMSAMAGIQRDKWVIAKATNGNIQAVKNDLPPDVVFTRAMYADGSQDSVTAIDWSNPKDLQLLVVAKHGDATRRVQQTFKPVKGPEIYRHLLSISDPGPLSIEIRTIDASNAVRPKPYLDGSVWLNSSDQSWRSNAQTTLGDPFIVGGLDDPDVMDYFAAHPPASAVPFNDESGSNHQWDMIASSPYTYFRTPPTLQNNPNYSAFQQSGGAPPTINVSGTAIWLVPNGVRFNDNLSIVSKNQLPATLIIVAQGNLDRNDEPDVGIWFFGGLTVDPHVSVFLISDGTVKIEHFNALSGRSTFAGYISIFAKKAFLMGPPAGSSMVLRNPWSLVPAQLDPILEPLYSLGLLPNTDATQGAKLDPIAGTWSESPH